MRGSELATLGIVAGFLYATSAIAQSQAQKLFDDGVSSMRAGNFEQACPAIAESYRLEPLPGVLFTLAECSAAQGKIATALSEYDEFLQVLTRLTPEQRAKHNERRQITLEKIAALSLLVPHITIGVPSNAPAGMVVKRDGEIVDPASYGVSVAVDPGPHEITAGVPGRAPFIRKVMIGKGERTRVDVEIASPAGAKPATRAAAGPYHDTGREHETRPNRTWAYVAGGIGIAGITVGGVFGLLAWRDKDTIDSQCIDRKCTTEGKQAVDRAQSMALVSTIGFGVGAAGLAAGAILYFSASSSEQAPPRAHWRPLVAGGREGAMAGVEASF